MRCMISYNFEWCASLILTSYCYISSVCRWIYFVICCDELLSSCRMFLCAIAGIKAQSAPRIKILRFSSLCYVTCWHRHMLVHHHCRSPELSLQGPMPPGRLPACNTFWKQTWHEHKLNGLDEKGVINFKVFFPPGLLVFLL